MRLEVLKEIRNKLKQVEDFKNFNHIIGVKNSIAQSDYPFISYIYTGETPEGDNQTILKIHLYFGVMNPSFDEENKEYRGHNEIISVVEKIKSFIYKNRIFAPYVMDSWIERIATDGGIQHPRYEGEIILSVRLFDKPYTEPLTKKIEFEEKWEV